MLGFDEHIKKKENGMEILSTVRAEVNRWTRDIIKPSHIYKGRFALPLDPKFWSQRRSEFVCRKTAKVGDLR